MCVKSSTSKGVDSTPFEPVEIIEKSSGMFGIDRKLNVLKTKMGKGGGTWAHLYILLDAAAQLDAGFKLQVYDTFVTNRILQHRDDSGDLFIALNATIDAHLQDRVGKDNKGVYIQIATRIRTKLDVVDGWNNASYTQLQARADLERTLCRDIRKGYIKTYEELKAAIDSE